MNDHYLDRRESLNAEVAEFIQDRPMKTFPMTHIVIGGPEQVVRMRLTPAIAEHWLALNLENRPIYMAKVQERKRDMEAGKWTLTHQGIAFDSTGTLSDGQHRLTALAQMPKSFSIEMYVFFNQSPAARRYMDINIPRSVSVRTGLDRKAVEMIRVILHSIKRDGGIDDYEQYYSEHKEAIDWLVGNWQHRPGVGQASVAAAFVRLYEYSPKITKECMDRLMSGLGMSEGDPMFLLRRVAIEGRNGKKIPKNELWNSAQAAVRAVIEGRNLKRLVGVKVRR